MHTILQRLASQIPRDYLHHASYDRAESDFHGGRISERQWRIFCLFWQWSAGRVDTVLGWPQERLRLKKGYPAVVARINRFRAALGLSLYR